MNRAGTEGGTQLSDFYVAILSLRMPEVPLEQLVYLVELRLHFGRTGRDTFYFTFPVFQFCPECRIADRRFDYFDQSPFPVLLSPQLSGSRSGMRFLDRAHLLPFALPCANYAICFIIPVEPPSGPTP